MTLTLKERIREGLRRVYQFEKIKKSFVFVTLFTSMAILSTPSKLIALSENKTEVKNQIVLALDSKDLIQSEHKISEIIPGESALQKAEREAREKIEAEAKAKAEVQAEAKRREGLARGSRVYAISGNFADIYARAGAVFGVDPRLLEAIHQVETGKSGSTSKQSYAGATGPMQFLPSTFRRHGVDGNGDGIKDITNVEDAIFAAANYLKACGYPNVKKALWGYNPSQSYYSKVTNVARSIGMPI